MKIGKIKTKVLFLATLLSHSTFAQDTSVTRDIWFFPKKGEFLTSVDAEYKARVTNIDFPGTPKLQDRSTKGGPTLAYAITDDFVLGAGFTLESKKEESILTATTKESNTASGLNDPAILGVYRVLRQDASGAFFDILLVASPSLGKAKTKNVLRGSHRFAGGLRAGQQREAVEYALGLAVAYSTEEKYEGGNSFKPRFDLILDAEFQYDFSSFVSANAEFALELPGDLKVKSGAGSDQELSHEIKLAAGPEFQISENLSAGAMLSYSKLEGELTNGPDFDTTSYALEANLSFVF